MKVLVTGANGFIGRFLCPYLRAQGYVVRGAFRIPSVEKCYPDAMEKVVIGEIGPHTDWNEALQGIDVVIHLAGRAHVMEESSLEPLLEYEKINTQGTKRLAELSAKAGVKRFIFLSTVKVNGEEKDAPGFCETDTPSPSDHYALSKWNAEQALLNVASQTGLDIVILRVPLVYGPGVKGNFLSLLQWVEKGIFLPFGSVKNSRSLIYLGNLADVIRSCIEHPRASKQIFLVSDHEDISTSSLICFIAQAFGKSCRLLKVPLWCLRLCGVVGDGVEKISGKNFPMTSKSLQRILGSLVVNSSKIRQMVGWEPQQSLAEGIKLTIEWYRSLQQVPKIH